MINFPEKITIQSCKTTILPRYSETDQGGVVHNSVYPIWFEIGRTELLRENKVAYKDLEAAGIFFVVAEIHIKYRRPAFYDEKLEIETTCEKVTASKIIHNYKITDPKTGITIAEGMTTLACINKQGKVTRIPDFMYPAE